VQCYLSKDSKRALKSAFETNASDSFENVEFPSFCFLEDDRAKLVMPNPAMVDPDNIRNIPKAALSPILPMYKTRWLLDCDLRFSFWRNTSQNTRAAKDNTFIMFLDLNSCVTKPNTRVPIGSPLLFTNTHEFLSNLITDPSAR
jgi:hypothetical protein